MAEDFLEECAAWRERNYAENKAKCANYAENCIFPWCDYCSFWCERKETDKCDTQT